MFLLLNVEVNSKKDGVGTVIEHDFNHIKVQFGNTIKKYDLDTKYRMRPSFENDVEVVNATVGTRLNSITKAIAQEIIRLHKLLCFICAFHTLS